MIFPTVTQLRDHDSNQHTKESDAALADAEFSSLDILFAMGAELDDIKPTP